MEVKSQIHAPLLYVWRKNRLCQFYRRREGSHSRYGRFAGGESLILTGNRTLDRPARSLSHYIDYAIPASFPQCITLTCMFKNRHT